MDRIYRIITLAVVPLVPLWLAWRKMRGKEEPQRLCERYGIASKPRPKGALLWLHAASVGEANSVLLLIGKIRERFPRLQMLLTTGTLTSAQLMQKRLPEGVIHQYLPLDAPPFVARFFRHWRPQMGLLVESELWPNLITAAQENFCFLAIVNGRMSQRSFDGWKKYPLWIGRLLAAFEQVFAQTEEDAARFKQLGARNVACVGNLKYDAALLPCDERELFALKDAIGARPLWLAASTHPGEEEIVANAHQKLLAAHPDLLCILVPRHPERGDTVAQTLKHFRVAQRSKNQRVSPDTQIYVADTLGELGLFYRLCTTVFMGGSLIRRGGQNPLEPARLACAIAAGPHTENFSAIYGEMEKIGAVMRVHNVDALAATIAMLLTDSKRANLMRDLAQNFVEAQGGVAARILERLTPAIGVIAP